MSPFRITAPSGDPRRGFALIIALSIMAFIVLLLISLTSFVRVELNSAAVVKQELEAKEMAMVGLYVALGDLQQTMGPDQSVSARADILDQDPSTLAIENVYNPYWTGVWRLSDPDDARTIQFVQWLVSGANVDVEAEDASTLVPDSEITLVSDRSIDGTGHEVTASKLSVNAGPGGAGSYAYWIGDEGVKAKINNADFYPEDYDPGSDLSDHLGWLRQPGNLNLTSSIFFDEVAINNDASNFNRARENNISAELAVGIGSFLATAPAGADYEPKNLFHDFTANSYSVLSDTRLGGLQRDLTAAFVYDDQMPAGAIIEREPNYLTMPEPEWSLLKSYVDLRVETNGASLPTIQARSQTDTVQGVAPLLAYLRMDYYAWYEEFTDPVTGVTENHLWVGFNPVVILVNPYDVQLDIDNFRVSFGDELATKLENIKIEGLSDTGLGPQIELSDIARPPKTFEFSGQNFQPGEVLIFSPTTETRKTANDFGGGANPFDSVNSFEKGYVEGFIGYQVDTGLVLGEADGTGDFTMERVDTSDPVFLVPGLYNGGSLEYTSPTASGKDNNDGKLFIDIILEDDQQLVAYLYEEVKIYQNGNNPKGPFAYGLPNFKSKLIKKGPSADALISSITLSKGDAFRATNLGGQPHALKFAAESLRAPKETKFQSSFRRESSRNDGSNLGVIYQDVANDRSVFGMRVNEDDAVGKVVDTRAIFFHVPRSAPMSIADLRHASLIPQSDAGDGVWTNNYPIASSFVHFERLSNIKDFTYRLNEKFWDGYYFSTYDEAEGSFDNRSLVRYGDSTSADLKSFDRSASKLLLNGGFNINSTSVEAWVATLSALSDRKILRFNPDTLQPEIIANATNPFLRTPLPLGSSLASDADPESDPNVSNFFGYRELSSDEILYLARGIVERIKLRGEPFPTLGSFVNRTLSPGGEDDVAYALGILQATIEDASAVDPADPDTLPNTLNDNFLEGLRDYDSGSGTNLITREDDLANNGVFWSKGPPSSGNKPFSKAAEGFFKGTGSPGYLGQGDILQAIGSQLRPRSDTFSIRAYGEVRNPVTDLVEASAFCEAIVQRIPEWVDEQANSPEDSIGNLNDTNQSFGRRYKIISLRWLNKSDI